MSAPNVCLMQQFGNLKSEVVDHQKSSLSHAPTEVLKVILYGIILLSKLTCDEVDITFFSVIVCIYIQYVRMYLTQTHKNWNTREISA